MWMRWETFSIPDGVARVNALLAGDIHLMDTLNPMLIDKINASSRARVLSTPSANRVPFHHELHNRAL